MLLYKCAPMKILKIIKKNKLYKWKPTPGLGKDMYTVLYWTSRRHNSLISL